MLTHRQLAALGIAGLLAAATAACSPAPEPTLGLQRDGSGYAVVVPLCADGHVSHVSVSMSGSGKDSKRWEIDAGPDSTDTVDRFPLFTAPPGWATEESALTALAPGTTYYAYAIAAANTRDSMVDFTLADLQSLKPDEVLTIKGARVKSAKFRTTALKLC
ncbi:hypothetical protein ACFQ6N_28680 [Kitasatospora sp. NPDC056446]|uniref:hypothetical protein n=1 Tax=Kitasatospora sp. NPDC056446 TaxID=3345819 RepID=UPI0036CB0A8B